MNDFIIYFKTGWEHIISTGAFDHLLFIAVLSAIYQAKHWKPLLILVTAFTIGHSLTLALSVYDIFRLKAAWVEFLIPLTIVLTAIYNFWQAGELKKGTGFNYLLALGFGLIHGMGFANTIRFMLAETEGIFVPLLSFNIGLEAGQIVVLALLLLLNYIFISKMCVPQKYWAFLVSALALISGVQMCIERRPF